MFFRSESLFLRPVWPEDRAGLIAEMGESFDPELLRQDRCVPPMLITLPGDAGAALIGVGTLTRQGRNVDVSCQMAAPFRDGAYAAEARAALRQMALLIG